MSARSTSGAGAASSAAATVVCSRTSSSVRSCSSMPTTFESDSEARVIARSTSASGSVDARFVGDLLDRRLPAETPREHLARTGDARWSVACLCGSRMRPHLLGERVRDRLPNPPDGVGDELHAAVGVEAAGGLDEADVPLVDQVEERDVGRVEALGIGDDEAEVRRGRARRRPPSSLSSGEHRSLDHAAQLRLTLRREDRIARDLLQVLPEDSRFVVGPELLGHRTLIIGPAPPGRIPSPKASVPADDERASGPHDEGRVAAPGAGGVLGGHGAERLHQALDLALHLRQPASGGRG